MTEAEQFWRFDPRKRVPIENFEPGRRRYGFGMPERARALFEGVAQDQDMYDSFGENTDEDYERLWSCMLLAFNKLEDEGLIEGSWQQWDGHELCEAIIQLTANGMRYVWLPLSEALKRNAGPDAEMSRFAARVKTFELFFVSFVKVATLDRHNSVRLAERPTKEELSGLCRHYARIVRVLFLTAQKATGRWEDWDVLEITGRARFDRRSLHMWNWLIDHKRGVIYSFDVTWADSQLDQGKADSIFNERLEAATLHKNRSAFLSMLFHGVGMGRFDDDLLNTIEASADGMLVLEWLEEYFVLHNMLYHGSLHSEVIDKLSQQLLERFELPADTDLEVRPGPMPWFFHAPSQLALLERIMGEEFSNCPAVA